MMLLALTTLLLACDEEESRPAGSQCTDDAQCASGLTCDWDRCRQSCETVTSCSGLPCVPTPDGTGGVCLDGEDFVAPCSFGCVPPTICDPDADRCIASCDSIYNPCTRDEICNEDGLCRSRCGDGVIDAGESCDDGGDSAECDGDCTPVECGDRHLNEAAGEVCDDGDTNPGDGCSSTCSSDESCGNGIIDAVAAETCDDSGDSAECDGDCTRPACGDGWFNAEANEECDDGDSVDDGEGGCSSRCAEILCGNGRLDPGEMLDRGEADPGHCFVCPGGAGVAPNCERCIYFVDLESETDHPDGQSWGSAFHTIQEAVDAAASTRPAGIEFCEVWVAAGTYHGEVEDGRVVALPPRVHLRGGFLRGSIDSADRGDAASQTILDGDGLLPHVVTFDAEEAPSGEALLEGFTISGGVAPTGTTGGGIYVSGGSTSLVVRRCRIVNNEAREAGGGLSLTAGADLWLESVVLTGNTAEQGAAIAADGEARLHVINGTFVANTSAAGPAAVVTLDDSSDATLINCIIDDDGTTRDDEVSPAVVVLWSLFGAGEAGDPLEHNQVGDPLFIDREGDDFGLAVGSPAIDHADGCFAPSVDLIGRARFDVAAAVDGGQGPRADLGAIEAEGGTPEGNELFFDTCCDASVEHEGRWYRRCDPRETGGFPWARARDACETHGARLVSIADLDENTATVLALAADRTSPLWIGGHQVPVADSWSWQWSDGESWSYPDGDPLWGWAEDCYPPSDDGGLCLLLDAETGRGCPMACTTASAYVCEEGGDL